MVVLVKSAPRVYKVVLTTLGGSRPYLVKRHNPNTSSLVFVSEDGTSFVHTLTHTSSAHLLKEAIVVGGRRTEAHAQSWFILGVLVSVFVLYWKSIIEEVFAGFLPCEGFPR